MKENLVVEAIELLGKPRFAGVLKTISDSMNPNISDTIRKSFAVRIHEAMKLYMALSLRSQIDLDNAQPVSRRLSDMNNESEDLKQLISYENKPRGKKPESVLISDKGQVVYYAAVSRTILHGFSLWVELAEHLGANASEFVDIRNFAFKHVADELSSVIERLTKCRAKFHGHVLDRVKAVVDVCSSSIDGNVISNEIFIRMLSDITKKFAQDDKFSQEVRNKVDDLNDKQILNFSTAKNKCAALYKQ